MVETKMNDILVISKYWITSTNVAVSGHSLSLQKKTLLMLGIIWFGEQTLICWHFTVSCSIVVHGTIGPKLGHYRKNSWRHSFHDKQFTKHITQYNKIRQTLNLKWASNRETAWCTTRKHRLPRIPATQSSAWKDKGTFARWKIRPVCISATVVEYAGY